MEYLWKISVLCGFSLTLIIKTLFQWEGFQCIECSLSSHIFSAGISDSVWYQVIVYRALYISNVSPFHIWKTSEQYLCLLDKHVKICVDRNIQNVI